MMPGSGSAAFFLTGDPAADAVLDADPNALLIGMVLDQQVPMEKAFSGPAGIADRMGGSFDVGAIAAAEPAQFGSLFSKPPAIHRFPGSMAARVQAVCRTLVEDWGGSVDRLYDSATSGDDLRRKIESLPGFGAQKARIFVAMLGKQRSVRPSGWREAAGAYGVDGSRISVADVSDPESLQQVRAAKKAAKQAARQQE